MVKVISGTPAVNRHMPILWGFEASNTSFCLTKMKDYLEDRVIHGNKMHIRQKQMALYLNFFKTKRFSILQIRIWLILCYLDDSAICNTLQVAF